jgi:hypothetical protein
MEIILFLYANIISTVNSGGSLPIVRKNVARLSISSLEAIKWPQKSLQLTQNMAICLYC